MGAIVIKAIDFFCGAGGLTRGLLDAGIQVVAGVDNDARLQTTYEHNNPPSRFICQDIRKTNVKKLREELAIVDTDTVLYAACTPCQPFSTLNHMKGEDKRKDLLLAFAKLLHQTPPDFLLVENVPGLSTAYGKEIYAKFLRTVAKCGFNAITADFLDAQNFGVPQVRKRFILLASRHGTMDLPIPLAGEPPTVREFIEKYPPIQDGAASNEYLNHTSRRLQPHLKRIVKEVPKNGGSRRDITDTTILLKCHQEHTDAHKDVFGRMSWDRPAPTLTARCTDVYCGRFVHPEQDRGISLREAAALQTFPDTYEFFGTSFHIQKQIGNAVPVKLAKVLGESILDADRRIKKDQKNA